VAVTLAVAAAACSDDDAADPTTVATGSSAAPGTTTTTRSTTTTTEATTTSSSTTTTAAAPPTTQSVDQLKAEIEAAFIALEDQVLAVLMEPAAPDVEAKIGQIAVPGSAYALQMASRVAELVANDQVVRLNEPNLRNVIVESIQVLDPPSNTHVNVTYCLVGNALLVKNAETSPIPGRSIPVGGTGELSASRFTLDLVLTPTGWRHSGPPADDSTTYEGADVCPPQ